MCAFADTEKQTNKTNTHKSKQKHTKTQNKTGQKRERGREGERGGSGKNYMVGIGPRVGALRPHIVK